MKDLHERLEAAIAEKGLEVRDFIQNKINAGVF